MTLNGTRDVRPRSSIPGFTSYSRHVQYTTDDVTGLIQPGRRTCSPRSSAPASTTTRRRPATGTGRTPSGARTPTLRADLYVTYADGTEQVDQVRRHVEGQRAARPLRQPLPGRDLRRPQGDRAAGTRPASTPPAGPSVRTVAGPAGTLRAQSQERTKVVGNWPAGTRTSPLPRRVRLRHRPAARRLGDDQGLRRARGHADPDPLRREARPERHGEQLRLHAPSARSRPTTTSPRAPARREPRGVHAAVHVQGLPVHPGQLAVEPGATQAGSGTPQPLPSGITVTVDSVQEIREPMAPTGVVQHLERPCWT